MSIVTLRNRQPGRWGALQLQKTAYSGATLNYSIRWVLRILSGSLQCTVLPKREYLSGVALELDDSHNVNPSLVDYFDHM